MITKKIFNIRNDRGFNELAHKIFLLQAGKNDVYKKYLDQLGIRPERIRSLRDIPFLPVEFFKTQRVITGRDKPEKLFLSSGTSGTKRSRHFVQDVSVYEKSFFTCFDLFYGNPEKYCLLALLPSYSGNNRSSLIYMADRLMKATKNKDSGFYLHNHHGLAKKIMLLEKRKQKTLLLSVSFALLEFAESFPMKLMHTTVMETGGMKGARPEMIREELHRKIRDALGIKHIHSEYGMTELLSQAYSLKKGIFYCPPWMKVLIRDANDYSEILADGQTGIINIIDLANINSCSFIATQDLGKRYSNGSFEVLGRFDNSDIRGCNLLFS